jgi:hypothetical protein
MGTGGPFPGAKRGRGVTLTTHPHLVPKSRMSRSYTSSLLATMACSGTALLCLLGRRAVCSRRNWPNTLIALMTEAVSPSETSANLQETTWRNIPEDILSCWLNTTKRRSRVVVTPASYSGGTRFTFRPRGYPHWDYSWFSLVPLDKCRGRTIN